VFIFIILAVAVVIAIVLIVLIEVVNPRRNYTDDRVLDDGSPSRGHNYFATDIEELQRLGCGLLIAMESDIESVVQTSDDALEIMASFERGIFGGTVVLHVLLAQSDSIYDHKKVDALKSHVRAERAAKGVLITNGVFSDSAYGVNEGPPIELLDGKRFCEELRNYGLSPASHRR